MGIITQIDIPEIVNSDSGWSRQCRRCRETSVPGVAIHACPGHSGDDASARCYLPDAFVEHVSDEDIARIVETELHRVVQIGRRGKNIVAIVNQSASPGHSGDDASARCHLADETIEIFCDVNVSYCVYYDTCRMISSGSSGDDVVL